MDKLETIQNRDDVPDDVKQIIKEHLFKLKRNKCLNAAAEDEIAIQASDNTMRTLLNTIPDLIWIKDPDGYYLDCNNRFEELVGKPISEIIGYTDFEIFDEELAKLFRENDKEAISHGAPRMNEEVVVFASDGHEEVLETVKVPIFSQQGEAIGILGISRDISKRKAVEKEVIRSESSKQKMVSNIGDVIVIIDINGTTQYISPNIEKLFGWKPEEVLNSNSRSRIHPDDIPILNKFIEKLLKKDNSVGISEFRYQCKDGNYAWIQFTGNNLLNDPDVGGLLGNFHNITERKQSEEALKRSEAFQNKMVTNIGDVIVIVDQEGNTRYISPNVEKLFGWKAADITNSSSWDRIHPDDIGKTREFLSNIMSNPHSVGTIEFRYKGPDGNYSWIQFTGSNQLHDPVINGMLGNYHDITKRKKAEEELLESEMRFKSLHNASFGGIAIHDKGVILDCNQGLSEMSGFSIEELIGMDGLLLIAPETRELVMNNIVTGYEKPYEAMGIKKNGETYPLRLEARNIPYKGKEVRSVEFRDITELKQAQTELIKNQKLESLGVLAGGIAHDFNNLLTGILGNFSLLEVIDDQENRNKLICEANKAATQAAHLARKLLAFAKGGIPETKVSSVEKVLKEAVEFSLSGHQVSYDFDIDPNLYSAKMDVGQIYQVFQNLAINARQSMPGGGNIHIKAENLNIEANMIQGFEHEGGKYVRVQIIDSGIGMTEDVLARVFEPYYTTKNKGSGLGLAVSYTVIKNHGGIIKAESTPGKGTCFCVYLPAVKEKKFMTEKKVDSPKKTSNLKVLVMDDEEMLRNILGPMLTVLGHQVVLTKDGQEALDEYTKAMDSEKAFDLVILDLTVPKGMGGEETLRNLKITNPDVLAIVSSGYSDNVPENFIDSLGKPFTLDNLKEVLARITTKFNL